VEDPDIAVIGSGGGEADTPFDLWNTLINGEPSDESV
jgi:hypothetical protein